MNKRFTRSAGAAAITLLFTTGAFADDAISPDVQAQMQQISSVKAGFSAAQKKMDSNLAYGILAATSDQKVASFTNAITPLSTNDVNGQPTNPAATGDTSSSFVKVEITGNVEAIASAVVAAGGTVINKAADFGIIDASIPLTAVNSIAASSDVTRMRTPSTASTNVGALTSQGYVSHKANTVVNTLGYNGTGVKVGVLSDSATAARITALKASGDLKASATVLAGQTGSGADEGTAMMEIVQDMAPGADLIFATAFTSEASFAANIVALANAGCKVIVDDVSYFDEGVFQDGLVAQAVNTVTAMGVTYFSSAANSGSLTKGTSGTWEGDFKNGGPVSGSIYTAVGETGSFHNFASSGTQNFDVLMTGTTFISLKWSDPLAGSANDYDLFVLNPAGTAITAFSGASQTGTQDPYEAVSRSAGFAVNSRIVVVQYAGAARAFHVDTSRGTLSIATTGSTYGHNAALNTMSMAATYWNSAKTGVRPFTGAANTNETFSSDGPRKIFFQPDGTAITPDNFLFATNGGTTLQKPDAAAADGVSTKTPGFLPFFGTSAAAPHAAGIAALILSARPDYNPAQVKAAMRLTALDSMAVGIDRDSGYGVLDANAAVRYALSH